MSKPPACPYCKHQTVWMSGGLWRCKNRECPGELPKDPLMIVQQAEEYAKAVQDVSDRIRHSVAINEDSEPDGPHAKKHLEESERLAAAARLLRVLAAEVDAGRERLLPDGRAFITVGPEIPSNEKLKQYARAREATDEEVRRG